MSNNTNGFFKCVLQPIIFHSGVERSIIGGGGGGGGNGHMHIFVFTDLQKQLISKEVNNAEHENMNMGPLIIDPPTQNK